MDNRKQVDAVFLDFSKAFDKVSHSLLIRKLQTLLVCPSIVTVIKEFLTDRTQRVVIEGSYSSSQPVTSGVPQGSVLGPLLFLIFINDLCKDLKSHIRLFADDTVLYREITSLEDHQILQQDLNTVQTWCTNNFMSLNFAKCQVMTVSRLHHNSDYNYILNNHTLKKVSISILAST